MGPSLSLFFFPLLQPSSDWATQSNSLLLAVGKWWSFHLLVQVNVRAGAIKTYPYLKLHKDKKGRKKKPGFMNECRLDLTYSVSGWGGGT